MPTKKNCWMSSEGPNVNKFQSSWCKVGPVVLPVRLEFSSPPWQVIHRPSQLRSARRNTFPRRAMWPEIDSQLRHVGFQVSKTQWVSWSWGSTWFYLQFYSIKGWSNQATWCFSLGEVHPVQEVVITRIWHIKIGKIHQNWGYSMHLPTMKHSYIFRGY